MCETVLTDDEIIIVGHVCAALHYGDVQMFWRAQTERRRYQNAIMEGRAINQNWVSLSFAKQLMEPTESCGTTILMRQSC